MYFALTDPLTSNACAKRAVCRRPGCNNGASIRRAAGGRSVESIAAHDSEAMVAVRISQAGAWCASASKVRVHATAASSAALRQRASTRDYGRPVSCTCAGLAFDAIRDRQASMRGCSRARGTQGTWAARASV